MSSAIVLEANPVWNCAFVFIDPSLFDCLHDELRVSNVTLPHSHPCIVKKCYWNTSSVQTLEFFDNPVITHSLTPI